MSSGPHRKEVPCPIRRRTSSNASPKKWRLPLTLDCARPKPLRSLRWRDAKSIFSASLAEWNKHKAPRLGASLAFYTLLSLAPLLLVLVSVVGIVLGHQTAEGDIVAQVRLLAGET